MNGNESGSSDLSVIVTGGGIGFFLGASMGLGIALVSGESASDIGWFVVPHAAFAMTLMGAWLAPCFVKEFHAEAKPEYEQKE